MTKRLPIRVRLLALVILFPVMAACDNGFTDGARVTRLEILAIQAEPPEAPPGAEVTWRALLARPPGGEANLTYSATQCTQTPEGCLEYLEALAWADGDEAQAEAAYGTLAVREGVASFDGLSLELEGEGFPLPMSALMGGLPSWEAELTWSVCSEGLCESAPTEIPGETALKRVVISASEAPNQNPVILTLGLREGEGGPAIATDGLREGDELTVHLSLGPGSVESYTFTSSDGESEQRVERPYVRWYSTAGRFGASSSEVFVDEDGGGESAVTLSLEGVEPGALGIYAVVRDRRGGIDFDAIECLVE